MENKELLDVLKKRNALLEQQNTILLQISKTLKDIYGGMP